MKRNRSSRPYDLCAGLCLHEGVSGVSFGDFCALHRSSHPLCVSRGACARAARGAESRGWTVDMDIYKFNGELHCGARRCADERRSRPACRRSGSLGAARLNGRPVRRAVAGRRADTLASSPHAPARGASATRVRCRQRCSMAVPASRKVSEPRLRACGGPWGSVRLLESRERRSLPGARRQRKRLPPSQITVERVERTCPERSGRHVIT